MTPSGKWIASNRTDSAMWHRGLRREATGARTGKVFAVYYVAACSGRKLGGAWGQTERDDLPDGAVACTRCAVLS